MGSASADFKTASLISLADAADALAKAAATLAEAVRTATEAFSVQTLVAPEEEGNQGINIGKGPDDTTITKPTAVEDENQRPGPGVTGKDTNNESGAENKPEAPLTTAGPPKKEPNPLNQPYHLLVEKEADVLLYVCALIDKRQRAICYMPCGTTSLKAYKQLLKSVTEISVYILTSTAASKLDQAITDFLGSNGSILLVPESLSPDFEIGGDKSWVFHVGWPVNETQYNTQRKTHRAQNNVLVAYSGDRNLYPSGDRIIGMTAPWPKDNASFRASVSILRPLYEVMLTEISLDMKTRVYQDWIQFHAIHGPRHVKEWTATVVVERANSYLRNVLNWSGPHTGGDIPLPEVSPGFVTQNELHSAVQDGILQVETDSEPEITSPSPAPRQEEVPQKNEFQLTTGHTYFDLEEEFDAVPLMCFISDKYHKTICLLEGHAASLTSFQNHWTPCHCPAGTNNNPGVDEAVSQFLSVSEPVILLLAYTTTNLPPTLKENLIDCCVYWGLGSPLKQAKKNRTLINCATTIIIMTSAQHRGMATNDLKKHPSAALPLDLTENSILAPLRDKMKSALISDKGIVRELYINRVYGVGAIPRTSLSAEDAAKRANQYAARVLLHGDPADGSKVFPPVSGRPPAPRIAVEKFKLQPAVDAGLLTIGDLRAERLSSLAHAAECLATATTTLSDAARAAAESLAIEPISIGISDSVEASITHDLAHEAPALPPLSSILLHPVSEPGVTPDEPDKGNAQSHENTGGKDISEVSVAIQRSPLRTQDVEEERWLVNCDIKNELVPLAQTSEQSSHPAGETEETSSINIEVAREVMTEVLPADSDLNDVISLEKAPNVAAMMDSTLGELANIRGMEQVIDPKQSYRILVENELDVLLTVCALIGQNQRVICYMPSGTPPLSFYKPLIEAATGAVAYFPERMSPTRRDAAYKRTLEASNSVALVPGTILPDILMEGENTWVIHVGCPPSYEKYVSRFKKHRAQNNVIVAYSGDLELYTLRPSLMDITQIWPGRDSLDASIDKLRRVFDDSLTKISDELKEKDWIQTHSVYGPRYVKAWDPIKLVEQANRYLVHILLYRYKDLVSNTLESKILPRVSWGFVTQNSLEPAYEAGVLQVKDRDSGPNHISSLPQADVKSSAAASTRVSTPTTGRTASILSTQTSTDTKAKVPGKDSNAQIPSAEADFKPASGHTYLPIEEEFDAIPLIGFMAEKYDKVICFLEGHGSLRHYQKLFKKILPSAQVIAPEAISSDQANNDAASRFVNTSSRSMLLLTYSTTNLPSMLRESKVGYCIYWGFHLPVKQAKRHRDQLTCSSSAIIITKSQQAELKKQSADIAEHANARTLLDLGPRSPLWPMRNTTVSILMTEESAFKGLYVNRIYGLGTVSRAERSAQEVLRMANRYSAKVLLRGDLEDGSEQFPPVAGRLPVPRTVVDRFQLQPAVTEGLAIIG
ncbi:hypothetical protein RHS01_05391 [Rhizoctonia solani]|uniref:Uncharacterized protein n=1 Tax=Rhizoctonia solani TaxID=456999 RepID=A0A8H7M4M5_9AGAM|nr:hypothetical protein RHS01_05391 [Rhizoctonia solani]